MDLVPEKVDDVVVINMVESCGGNQESCGGCSDFSVAVHNMVMASNIQYIIIDFQDEKYVCPALIEELLQLKKRLKFPFMFVGLMPAGMKVIESYSFNPVTDVFPSPDDAISHLKSNCVAEFEAGFDNIVFGQPLVANRSRMNRNDGDDSDDNDDD